MMVRFIQLPGVRLLEAALQSSNLSLIPSGLSAAQFADQLANVHFGITVEGLFGRIDPTWSDDEVLQYELKVAHARSSLVGELLGSDEEILFHFSKLGFDVSNDARKLAVCAPYFLNLIEAGAAGWLSPCPNENVEKWRRLRMGMLLDHANDDFRLMHRQRASGGLI